jgi:hypothetical protein
MQVLQQQDSLIDEQKVNVKFLLEVPQQQNLLIEEQKVNEPTQPTILPGPHNETTSHDPIPTPTHNTPDQHTNNINKGLYMQPQIHTAGTRHSNVEQVLL